MLNNNILPPSPFPRYMYFRDNNKMNLNTCVLNGVSRECYFIIYERELKCDEVWTNKSA